MVTYIDLTIKIVIPAIVAGWIAYKIDKRFKLTEKLDRWIDRKLS